MQQIATKIFIIASVLFGVFGVLVVLTLPMGEGVKSSLLNMIMGKLLITTGFIVLSSFALSVAGKYLNGKR